MERKTPLYDCHVAAGGKIVPFAGWLLPVQYSGVVAEHMAVRTACGTTTPTSRPATPGTASCAMTAAAWWMT